MALPRFTRQLIYQGTPSERTTCVVGDLNQDGLPEIVIGARAPTAELYWLGRNAAGAWERHEMDAGFETLEAGGALFDLDGDGQPDFVGGQDARGDRLFWWQNPGDPVTRWARREIVTMPAKKTHDQMIASLRLAGVDVHARKHDNRPDLYFWNQQANTLFFVPLPDDPRVYPWPGVGLVATDVSEEGLCHADVDGDGQDELIAGQSWYKWRGEGGWQRHEFAQGYVSPKSVAADFDADGRPEIVLAEGDASLNKREYGRVALFKARRDPTALWEEHVLHDRLLDPHSLQVADFTGDGRPDLFVGEMGLPRGNSPHPPAQRIYVNEGGQLREQIIDEGLGTHESKVIVLDGRVGIVGKPFRVLRTDAPREPEVDGIWLWLPERQR